jgi:hypothetical protein
LQPLISDVGRDHVVQQKLNEEGGFRSLMDSNTHATDSRKNAQISQEKTIQGRILLNLSKKTISL